MTTDMKDPIPLPEAIELANLIVRITNDDKLYEQYQKLITRFPVVLDITGAMLYQVLRRLVEVHAKSEVK